MKLRLLPFLISFTIGLMGCSSTELNQPQTSLDPVQRGKALFEMNMIGENKAPGCIVCHSLEPGKNLVGPSLAGIATYAQSAGTGMEAADFLRQAIVEPDKHVMEGYPTGVMYQNYGKDLPQEDIEALVAFLLTLK
ncbi:MAG: Nitric-oxide reductase subunit C [Anaerolineae bacterium]|jgi:cytochrome c551/c552|nr:MAG: Nitric-oxide reductase subunit C [Anaerolineae bacterium]